MSRVALLTDVHFGAKRSSELLLSQQLDFFNLQVIPHLQAENIDTICILGDLMDNRQNISVNILSAVYKLFKNMNAMGFKVHILVGNHDIFHKTSIDTNSIEFLDSFENVTIHDEINITEFYGVKTLMVPWIISNDNFAQQLASGQYIDCKACMGHFEIKNAIMHGQTRCEHGLDPEAFTGLNKIFSGHFHSRSKMKIKSGEIEYIGNICQLNRGDAGEERGYGILDMNTLEVEYFENKYASKYVMLEIGDKIDEKLIKNNYVDVIVKVDGTPLTVEEIKKRTDYIRAIEALKPIVAPTIKIVHIQHIVENVEIQSEKILTLEDCFNMFISDIEIDEQSKERIKTKLMSYYNVALTEMEGSE